MRPVLVLRPEPGATATARRAEGLGLRAIVAPLFAIEPVDWAAPDEAFDALMLTSASAVRMAGAGLAACRDLPGYAVGAATAEAMRSAGFAPVRVGEGNADDLVAALERDGRRSALHLTGEDFRAPAPTSVRITHIPVYRAAPLPALAPAAVAALDDGAVVLLHSSRAAVLFAQLFPRRDIALAAISPAAAEAAGPGWHSVTIAAQPSDQALLAAAARLCEE